MGKPNKSTDKRVDNGVKSGKIVKTSGQKMRDHSKVNSDYDTISKKMKFFGELASKSRELICKKVQNHDLSEIENNVIKARNNGINAFNSQYKNLENSKSLQVIKRTFFVISEMEKCIKDDYNTRIKKDLYTFDGIDLYNALKQDGDIIEINRNTSSDLQHIENTISIIKSYLDVNFDFSKSKINEMKIEEIEELQGSIAKKKVAFDDIAGF